MKKIIISGLLLIGSLGIMQAQNVMLNLYSGYVFDDRFETINGGTSYFTGKILGGYQWGGGLEYKSEDYGIELLYYRQDTEVPVNYYRINDVNRTLEAGVNYIMLGGVRYADTGGRVTPYGGAMAGMVIYRNKEPQAGEPNSLTRFAWGARLGANIWATDKVGIKLQAQILSAVQALGGAFYVGTGGSGGGISAYSTLFQFTLGGGLVFRFGDE